MKIQIRIYIGFFICFLGCSILLGQSLDQDETLLEEAMKNVYTNPEKSIETGEKYLKKAEGDALLTYRYFMLLAQAHVMLAEYEQSLDYANKALKLAEQNNLYPSQINANTFLGNHYLRLQLKEKAWESLERSEKILREHPLPDSLGHIQGNVFLLRGYLLEGDAKPEEAIQAFGKAADLFEKAKNKELGKINLGVVLTHKGRTQLGIGQLDSAEISFQKVIDLSAADTRNGVDAFALLSLAEVYSRQNKWEESNRTLHKALEISKNSNQIELEMEVYKLFSTNYFKSNDLDNYSKYDQLYKKALEKFNKTEINSVEKVAKTAQLKEEISDISTWKWIIFSVILIVFTAFLFFKAYKLKKKMKS